MHLLPFAILHFFLGKEEGVVNLEPDTFAYVIVSHILALRGSQPTIAFPVPITVPYA